MNLRRTPLMQPQGLDIAPMPPPQLMQFAPPPPPPAQDEGTQNAMSNLMQMAQQYRAGQVAKQGQQAAAVQGAETDAPLQRRKLPFADIAAMAQANA